LLVLTLAGADDPAPKAPNAATTTVALCGADEPGRKLVFQGRVLDHTGQPLAKAAVMAYNADQNGLYAPAGSTRRVPRIRGVAVTDDAGRFRFSTVWPGAYPNRSQPAHIHVGVLAAEHKLRYVTVWFEGDPLLTDAVRKDSARDPEVRIVKPERNRDGVWRFETDIRLEDA
jgi:protocatechuate 3,4-dioxygenase beta subunit